MFVRRLRWWKVTAALSLPVAAYFGDTQGAAEQRIAGVVIDTDTASHLEFKRFQTRTVTVSQSRISIPGRTFWCDASFDPGERVAVVVVVGRFSGWRYISCITPDPR